MKKNLFLKKNNNRFYKILLLSFLSIIILYFILFYISINQKYFIINNDKISAYYVVPIDKEGEKVKFVDKKSINDLSSNKDYKLSNIDNLEYTIQVYSDVKFENVMNYFRDLISLKSDIILEEDLYIFSINTEIGDDYFLTYKNYESKIEAFNNCKNLIFIKDCLIINPSN